MAFSQDIENVAMAAENVYHILLIQDKYRPPCALRQEIEIVIEHLVSTIFKDEYALNNTLLFMFLLGKEMERNRTADFSCTCE